MKAKGYLFITWGALLFSCQQHNNGGSKDEVPQSENSSRVDYSLLQYWQHHPLSTIRLPKDSNALEQQIVDFIAAFPENTDSVVTIAIANFLDSARPYDSTFRFVTDQLTHYLYDPNSPMRNDRYYEPVVAYLAEQRHGDEAEQYRNKMLLKLIRKNNVGQVAENLSVELSSGNTLKILDIQTPFTILFFYEPGCTHCEQSIQDFQSIPAFQQLIAQKLLTILAIYPFGDRKLWQSYENKIPKDWLNSFDTKQQILTKHLYDIKATPTIYILGKDKRVIAKDTDIDQIIALFKNLIDR